MQYFRHIFAIFLILIAATSLTGCDKNKSAHTGTQFSDAELYDKSIMLVEAQKYDKAVNVIEDLELEYPTSQFIPNAMYIKAKTLYGKRRYDEALVTIDMFTKQFPYDERVEELLFIKGLCHYDQVMDVGRDQKISEEALSIFGELLEQYPQSRYRVEAKLKMEYLTALLAGKQMEIGYFYYQKHNYSGALRRFQNVYEDFSTTIFVPEALYRISEIFLILNIPEEANTYAAILGANFPESEWYHKLYKIIKDDE